MINISHQILLTIEDRLQSDKNHGKVTHPWPKPSKTHPVTHKPYHIITSKHSISLLSFVNCTSISSIHLITVATAQVHFIILKNELKVAWVPCCPVFKLWTMLCISNQTNGNVKYLKSIMHMWLFFWHYRLMFYLTAFFVPYVSPLMLTKFGTIVMVSLTCSYNRCAYSM